MLWTGGKVTSNTPSAQTAVDERLLPALWALWNCRDNSVFISRNEKSWGKMSEERPVKKHMWQTPTAFTVTLIQDDFFLMASNHYFYVPVACVIFFDFKNTNWWVGRGGDNSLGNFKASIYQSRYLSRLSPPLLKGRFFLPLSPSVRWGGAI